MDLAIAFGKPHTAVRPVDRRGSTTSPSSPSSTSTAPTASSCCAELVDELGGLDALAPATRPGPRPSRSSKLDFARRHLLKLTLLDRWGALPGANDRHLAEFIPSVLTEESGWGATLGHRAHPHGAGARSTRTSTSPRSTPCWPGTEELQTWDSGELVAPVIDSLVTGTAPRAPAQPAQRAASAPTCPPTPWWSRSASSTATACAGRDAAPRAGAVRRAAAPPRGRPGADGRGGADAATGAWPIQAFALDPLAGRGDLRDTEAMVDELLAGTADGCPSSPDTVHLTRFT